MLLFFYFIFIVNVNRIMTDSNLLKQPKEDFSIFEFSDIYINLRDPSINSYLFHKKINKVVEISEDTAIYVRKLAELIRGKYERTNQKSFRVSFCNRLYRVTLIKSVEGVFAKCRSQPKKQIPLREIGLPPLITNLAQNRRLCSGGLVLVVGSVGSGKTTTCAAIGRSRIELFGGVMLTIEDPAELPMHGPIGNGLCIQYEIETKEDFLEAGRLALRCYPADKNGVLFIGEIRDSESAQLALRASLDGRLVLATMHGDSVSSALKRIVSFASDLNSEEVYALLHSGFRLCIHQKMTTSGLEVEVLADTQEVSQLIMQKKLDHLTNEIDRQKILRERNQSIDLRKL